MSGIVFEPDSPEVRYRFNQLYAILDHFRQVMKKVKRNEVGK